MCSSGVNDLELRCPLAAKVMNVTRNGLSCVMRTLKASYVLNLSQVVGVRSNANMITYMFAFDRTPAIWLKLGSHIDLNVLIKHAKTVLCHIENIGRQRATKFNDLELSCPLAGKVINVMRNGLECVRRTSGAMYVPNLSQIVGVRGQRP